MGSTTGYPMGRMVIADADAGRGPRGGEPARGAAEAAGGSALLAPMPPHPRRPGPALMRVGRLDPVVAPVFPGGMVPHWEAQARVGWRLRNAALAESARERCVPTVTDVASGTRRCGGCAVWLPAEAFHHNAADGLLGRVYRCKACLRAAVPQAGGGA